VFHFNFEFQLKPNLVLAGTRFTQICV